MTLTDGNELVIVFAYFRHHLQDFPTADLDTLLDLHPHTIVIGDYNSRHESWGNSGSNQLGRTLYNHLDDRPEYILLAPDDYTFGSNRATKTTIDLAVTN